MFTQIQYGLKPPLVYIPTGLFTILVYLELFANKPIVLYLN